jgi:hypothetical protein
MCTHRIGHTDHCMHATVQSMQNLYIMTTSHSEQFLYGPNDVHYTEVLLYLFRNGTLRLRISFEIHNK